MNYGYDKNSTVLHEGVGCYVIHLKWFYILNV